MNVKSLKLLPVIVLGGLLAACGGDDVGTEDNNLPTLPPEIEPVPSDITILETPLPIIEDFSALDAEEFFNPVYKALATPATNEIFDSQGNPVDLVDPWPSFYYPTCCFFDSDPETGEIIRTEPYTVNDYRLRVADGKMGMSNSRFTIGQILSDRAPSAEPEGKSNTTDTPGDASIALGSWGELDLISEAYRISFCLSDFGVSGSGASNIEVWVDNNGGGRQGESIHGPLSLLLRAAITGTGVALESGNRIVVNVPGDVYMVDDNGNRIERNADGILDTADDLIGGTLGVIQPLDGFSLPVGTATSFLQFRVSSGGYMVIDDLIIELQSENNAQGLVCDTDPGYWGGFGSDAERRQAFGLGSATMFAGLPLAVDASLGEIEFFGQVGDAPGDAANTTGQYLAVSDNQYDNFFKEEGSSSRIFVEAENNAVRFGQARWSIGRKDGLSDNCDDFGGYDEEGGGCPGGTPNGDIDLSQPYRIRAQVLELPEAEGQLQVYIDNYTSGSGNSVHGSSSRITQLTNTFGELNQTGELVINVPGDILLNGSSIGSVSGHVGTTTSFVAFRCPSNCGQAVDDGEGNLSGGIVLGDVEIEAQ